MSSALATTEVTRAVLALGGRFLSCHGPRDTDESATVVPVVPLTSTIRSFGSEVLISPDAENGLDSESAAQCQHVRSVSVGRSNRSGATSALRCSLRFVKFLQWSSILCD